MARHAFTIDEANALIPHLKSVFEKIESHHNRIGEIGEKVSVLGLLWGEKLDDESNPDYETYASHKQEVESEVEGIERLVNEEIVAKGIRFPAGGIENGLVDFPSTFEGRWIYLCWRNGETELKYWHEVHAGYRGRQMLGDEHRSRMGIEDNPADVDDIDLDFDES